MTLPKLSSGLLFSIALLCCSCEAQHQSRPDIAVGGPCEGCEAIYEYGNKALGPIDTLPTFQNNSPKLHLTGTVFQKDGVSPAEGVIIYAYHTDREGVYPIEKNADGWARRHGFIRGWVKTDKNGQYSFYTIRPASYPSRTEEEHIHLVIKESGYKEYYIDSVTFEGDPLLSTRRRENKSDRGGSGITNLIKQGDMLFAKRDIILGMNIPDYP